ESYSSFNGSISLWFNETEGIMGDVPGFGPKTLAYPNATEMQREIKYIVIRAARLDSYTWMPSFVNDLYLEYVGSEVSDTTDPTIIGPIDFSCEAGATEQSIIWTIDDENPSHYELYVNDVLVDSGDWDGSDFEITVDTMNLGEYIYSLKVFDDTGNSAVDVVMVYVEDTTAPTVYHPSDIEYEAGSIGNQILFSAYDLYPESYELYMGSILVSSSSWDDNLTLSIDNLDPGAYSYHIVYYDESGNSASSTVSVTVVDTTAPVVSTPADIHYKEGETGNSITWDSSDLYPGSYVVSRNGSVIQTGDWNATNEQLVVDVDGLGIGGYLYLITFIDESGNSAIDVVLVTVLPQDFDGFFTSFSFVITVGSTMVIIIVVIIIFRNRGQSGGSGAGYY
ncbi:MAG: hypothetical protein ACTSV2_02970, partial [Candidatus Thorarchaeota archaeon]